jgi:FtsH-binding integral membrane protein
MNNNALSISQVESVQRTFIQRTYLWMAMALAVTAVIAFVTANTPALLNLIFGNGMVLLGLVIAQVIVVIALSWAIGRIPAAIAMLLFFGYAALTGLVLASIFLVYTEASIATTFVATAGMFGIMSIYGLTTGRDLTSLGNLFFMALIGLIIASVVNLFLQNDVIYWLISAAGVVIFVGLTAYDAQKLKEMAVQVDANSESGHKASVLGALRLYLDFINLFLFLLRFMGRSRD